MKHFMLLIVFVCSSSISKASSSFSKMDLLNLNDLHSRNAVSFEAEASYTLNPKLKYSCDHVRYMLKRYDSVLDEMIESFKSIDLLDKNTLENTLASNKTFKRNLAGINESYLFEEIVEIELNTNKFSTPSLMFFNNFKFGFIPNSKENISLKLNYLDICQDKKIKFLALKCADFNSKSCQDAKAFTIDLSSLETKWNNFFWQRSEK